MQLARVGVFCLVGLILLFLIFMVGGTCLSTSTEATMQKQLRNTLQDITQCFHLHQVDYWLDFGTALGQFRDQDIIVGDMDIDLGIHENSETLFLDKVAPCLTHKYKLVKGHDIYRLYLRQNSNINCDVYIYRENSRGQLVYSKITADPHTILPTRDVPFSMTHPFPVRVMAHAHDSMTLRYGQDYRTPRRNDKGTDSDPTLAQNIPPWIHSRLVAWRNALHIRRNMRKDTTPP